MRRPQSIKLKSKNKSPWIKLARKMIITPKLNSTSNLKKRKKRIKIQFPQIRLNRNKMPKSHLIPRQLLINHKNLALNNSLNKKRNSNKTKCNKPNIKRMK